MADNLKSQTLKGAGWSFADNIIKLGVSFVVGIVMARLLNPSIYGIVGVVTIFTSLFSSFIDCGLSTALIRKQDAKDVDYSTIFIANFALGLFFYFLLFLCAPFISNFFSIEELTPVLRVAGLCILIDSSSLIQKTILTKRIDFKTQTKATFLAGILSGAIGITLAYLGFGVWALVSQILASSLFISIQLWIYNRWIPKMKFSISSFKEMFGFGWKLMLIGLMTTLWQDLYNFVIGKFYSPTSLGLYNRAKQFPDIFSKNLITVVQRVSMPVLSTIQNDEERLKNAYVRSLRITAFVTFMLLMGLSGINNSLIYVLLGDKWMSCAEYIPLVAANVLLYPIGVINLNLIAIKGRSDYCLYVEIIKKSLAIVPVVIGIFFTIKMMLYASIVVSTISYFFNIVFSKKVIDYGIMEQLKDIIPSFLVSLVMFGIVKSIEFSHLSFYSMLPIQIIAGFAVVIAISKCCRLHEYAEIRSIAISFLSKFIQKK